MNPLAQWFTWEGAPCQVGTRLVELASLSSKSTCNICCTWSSGYTFGLCIPVSSLQYQLIGKLLGSSNPLAYSKLISYLFVLMQSRVKVGSQTPFPKDPPCPIFLGTKNLENFQYKPEKKFISKNMTIELVQYFFHKGVTT